MLTEIVHPTGRLPADSNELLVPFINAAQSVMATMLQVNCVAGETQPVRSGHHMHQISAMVGLSGDIVGSISFSTTTEGAFAILERMTGMEATGIDEFVRDAIGEMANMIAGFGKRDLEHFSLRLGLPQVIVGQDIVMYSPRWSRHFWVPLETDLGPCSLDIGFGEKAN